MSRRATVIDPVTAAGGDFSRSAAAPLSRLKVEHPAGGFIRPYHRQLAVLGRAIDLFWVIASLRVSMVVAGWTWDLRHTLLAAVAAIIFYLAAEAVHLYDDRRSHALRFDLRNLVVAWFSTAIVVMFLGYALKVSDLYSRVAVITWFALAPTVLAAWQVTVRTGLTKVRTLGYNIRRVAIVGASEQGMQVARAVAGAPWMGLKLIGIFDDRSPAPGRIPTDLPTPLLGKMDDLMREVGRGRVDMVYVTLPINNTERIGRLLNVLSDTTTSVYFVPDMFLFSMFNGRWVRIGELPAVSVFETPFYGIGGWIKRAEDLVFASLVLMIMAVPMLAIALSIRLTSPGPALFRQRRYGLDGREFGMWKFRTMTTCQDEGEIPQATRADPRVTRVGAFLRRTSLDELPQFLNVLGGTMSVIGPRPHATAHNEYYRRLVRHYMVRHKVRPGISGWAQASGWRGETDTLQKMEARVEYDLWYIRNWSVLLDLKIILMTLRHGWRDHNAY
jgi:putative colanic acid biosysnthesis UDP-glucose lipid carrier transferase